MRPIVWGLGFVLVIIVCHLLQLTPFSTPVLSGLGYMGLGCWVLGY